MNLLLSVYYVGGLIEKFQDCFTFKLKGQS